MRILISNDDGYLAPGIRVLAEALASVADTQVVAPDRNRSGASNALTLTQPLRVHHHRDGVVSVEGTPADCVLVAVNGLFEHEHDMVVSGINNGPNMGDDVLYSGTVAAAVEGRHLGLPALAISMATHRPRHYDSAARVAAELVQRMESHPLPADTILNVNVPDLPYEQLAGFKSTRLGNRHKSEPVIPAEDPRGDTVFWIGPAGAEADAGAGTDFDAVKSGFVSVTPLQIDLTRYTQMQAIENWLEQRYAPNG